MSYTDSRGGLVKLVADQLAGRLTGKGVIALVVVLVVLLFVRRKPKRRREGASDRKRGSGEKGALGKLWALLCPKLEKFELGGGGWQLYGILLLSLIRIWLMSFTSRVVQRMDVNAMSRDQTEFWSGWMQHLRIAVASCVHRQTYKYVENSLAIAWREKLTQHLHTKYFAGKVYYVMSQQSAQGSGGVADPDERIGEDAKEVATQLAHVFCEGIYASTAGTFFAFKLGQLYGMHFALAPYIYLWSMFAISKTIAPIKLGKWIARTKELFASYRGCHQQLVSNSEAIAALGGRNFEETTLFDQFRAAISKAREFHVVSIWPNLVESLAYNWFLRSFMATFIVGPHLYWSKKVDLSSISAIAKLKGDVGHQFVLFVQSMIAAGTTAKMLNQLSRISGSAIRVQKFLTQIKQLPSEEESHVKAGETIEFENVDIYTPDRRLLVKNLSFTLEKGTSLLLTGHNGAGKSSIFRCLGGLWTFDSGSITKPGSAGDGLHQQGGVYYLPQKPYNVRGTLTEQMAYPVKDADLPVERLREVLQRVDLLYLHNQHGDNVVNWDEILSLGEMQRLAIARLLFHEPAFAILDECTSAVSGEMERQLYEVVLKEANTAYITISHRPVLKAYHDQLLTIGMPDAAYTLEKLNPLDYVNETSRNSSPSNTGSPPASPNAKMQTNLVVAKKETTSFEKASLKSFLRLVSIGLPKKKAFTLAVAIASVATQVWIKVKTTENMSAMMSGIFRQDSSGFGACVGKSVALAIAGATVEQIVHYIEHTVAEDMMEGLTKSLLSRYIETDAFYKLTQLTRSITDPQQRMTNDLRSLTNATAALIPQLLRPCVELTWFSYCMGRMIGPKAVAFFGVYLAIGGGVIRAAMPSFRKMVTVESDLEGHFKHAHTRVKNHSESIAFFGGGSREKGIVNDKFGELMIHSQKRLVQTLKFNLVNGAIVREAPFLVQWILRNEFGKNVSDAEVLKDGGEKMGTAQAFIFDATTQMFDCVGQLLTFAEHLENLYGLVGRVSELDEELVSLAANTAVAKNVIHDNALGLTDASITTPTGMELAKHVTVNVTPEKPLMVTGPNAIGKTSFFRVLGGLWPVVSGTVTRPKSSSEVFLVPQQVFMVFGTLADQVTYPQRLTLDDAGEEKLLGLMRLVGVDYLAKCHGWDEVKKWDQILSLGEQQRIGMARLFYHMPTFGILDECTSAVSVDVERHLYEEARRRGITCVTISQRLALTEFHTHELNFGDQHKNGWRISKN